MRLFRCTSFMIQELFMDYIGNKCPVCQKYFHADDDVVVCPDCGTPHHRECYESLGHCYNEKLHEQGYDYQEDKVDETDGMKICLSCGHANNNSHFFCGHCGAPLSPEQAPHQQQTPPHGAGIPFGQQQNQQGGNTAFNIPFMDPLAGVDSNTDFGDGITAGETAKYVKQNTPYFIRVFNNIKTMNKSKFNFSAALFTGGYLLYRKMYKIGILFTVIQLALLVVESYFTIAYSSLYTDFLNAYSQSMSSGSLTYGISEYMQGLSATQLLVLYLPTLVEFARIAMMIVFGICFNRMYFKHCKKQITKIKSSAKEDENPEMILQTKGGVNTPLAISLMVTYLIILYLPSIITGLM